MERLTLSEALASDRLNDFIEQAEAEGHSAADRSKFDAMVKRFTAPLPSDRTSRSPARGGSRGK